MPTKKCSRQSDWRRRMKNDPNGPQLKRLDGYISKSSADMLVTVQDSLNFTKRQTLEFAIQMTLLLQTLRGKITDDRLADHCWAAAEQARRTRKRMKGSKAELPVTGQAEAENGAAGG